MLAAEVLVDSLVAHGVTHLFYVPVISPPAIKGLTTRGVVPVVAHGEKAAAYMADGYARVSGRVGVCASQAIGSTNLAAGLRDAWLGRSPVLALSGGPEPVSRDRNLYQDLDDRAAFGPVTRSYGVVDRGDRMADVISSAFRSATTGAPRPVAVSLAGFWGSVTLDDCPAPKAPDSRFGSFPALRPAPDSDSLNEAVAAIAGAERPLLLIGGGARRSDAGLAIRALVDRSGMPSVSSLNGMGLLPDGYDGHLGVAGDYGRDSANRALAESDCVVVIGSSLGSMTTKNWRLIAPGARIVQIDVDPAELGRNYFGTVPLLCDSRTGVDALATGVTAPVDPKWRSRVEELRAEWESYSRPLESSSATPIRPEALLGRLSDALPDDVVLVGDTGHVGAWAARHLRLRPGQTFLRAAGSLGWGLPAAIGAKCGAPDRPVVCLTGDGGLLYHVAEIETAVRYDIPLVVVVNNNVGMNQEMFLWDAGTEQDKNWKFHDTDLVALATALGAGAERVDDASEIGAALHRALRSGRPFLVDVRTDPAIAAPPTWGPAL